MSTPAHKRAPAPRAGQRRRQRGAAVLILLLLVGLGMAAVMMQGYGGGRDGRERQALQVLSDAQQALIGYAITHGRLPRPAVSAADGAEYPLPCDSEQRCTGYLPWATLGLPPMYARGQPLRYSVTPAFAAQGATLSTAVATKTIAWRDGATLRYRLGQDGCAPAAQCLPAVLIASGKPQSPDAAGLSDQAANARASVHFIQRPLSDDERAPGAAFDDILAWLPYSDLRVRMVAAGSWQ